MSRGSCPRIERDGCPVSQRKKGCFSDIDHRVPQRYAYMGWLVAKYIHTEENKVRLCRWEHEQKTLTETPDLIPSDEDMLYAIQQSYEGGTLVLNNRDKQRLALELSRIALEEAS